MISAVRPKAEQSTKQTSSRSCPSLPLNLRLVARPNSTTAVWLGRYFSCGSRVRLPIRMTRFALAMFHLLQSRILVLRIGFGGFVAAEFAGRTIPHGTISTGTGRRRTLFPGRAIPRIALFARNDRLRFNRGHFLGVEMIRL